MTDYAELEKRLREWAEAANRQGDNVSLEPSPNFDADTRADMKASFYLQRDILTEAADAIAALTKRRDVDDAQMREIVEAALLTPDYEESVSNRASIILSALGRAGCLNPPSGVRCYECGSALIGPLCAACNGVEHLLSTADVAREPADKGSEGL